MTAFVSVLGCGPSQARDRFEDPSDGSAESDAVADSTDEALVDADPDLFGPCVDDKQCVRTTIPCADFKCDKSVGRCRAIPDDTRCDDGLYCNGKETCDPRRGCVPGPVVDCSDKTDSCFISRCIEASKKCEQAPRDADGDGDPSASCAPLGKDCNDRDPNISSKVAEVCGNKVDDNCDGNIDETPCVSPKYATCDTALTIDRDGTYALSLDGTTRTISTECAPSVIWTRQNVVAIKVPDGGNKDVDVTAQSFGTRLALASGKRCGDGSTETACVTQPSSSPNVRFKLRNLAPGIYPLYVLGQVEGKVELRVSYQTPSTTPVNTTCTTAVSLLPKGTSSVSISGELTDIGTLPTACSSALGPLVYRVDITEGPKDLLVRASTRGSLAQLTLGLRDASCIASTSELRCGATFGTTPAEMFVRKLPVGTYYITLGGSATTDFGLEVSVSAPAIAPAGESCGDAPELPRDVTTVANLKGYEDNIAASCFATLYSAKFIAPDSAYSLKLDAVSDVLVVARTSGSDFAGIGLTSPSCTAMDLGCARGLPARINRRGLPIGEYRVVLESTKSSQISLSTFVRPTFPPGGVGADSCKSAMLRIPSTGGFFVGSTAGATADLDASCDTAGVAKGGAPEVMYQLVLTKKSRVVLDAFGSAYPVILSIRKGDTCPGTEVPDMCAAGYAIDNAFLDVNLDAGTYWIVVDGYALSSGAYKLDIRTAPPIVPI